MGCPIGFSRAAQIGLPLGDIKATLDVAVQLSDRVIGRSIVQNDPVGVVAAITPWNFPLHQIMAKIAPALAAGCTVVLKPSEVTPLDAVILAEIFHDAGAPGGVFNLIVGGRETGEALVSHPDIDMISFTGSTAAGTTARTVVYTIVALITVDLIFTSSSSTSWDGERLAQPVIEVRHVTKHYENRPVLDAIDLDVFGGETLVVMGGSGSGKSTLLQVAHRQHHPTTGETSSPSARACRA